MPQRAVVSDSEHWEDYRQRLFRFIVKRVDDPEVAADLAQDVLLKALQRLDQLQDREKLMPWLYQLTRTAVADFYRKKPLAQVKPMLDSQQDDSGRAAAEQELACCLQPFIRELPVVYRRAILLSDIRGLTQQQLADQEGISLSGAKSRVQRARKMLKQKFLECCHIQLARTGGIADAEGDERCKC